MPRGLLQWCQQALTNEADKVLMKLGATVVATDLPELLPHMEYNLQLNEEGRKFTFFECAFLAP